MAFVGGGILVNPRPKRTSTVRWVSAVPPPKVKSGSMPVKLSKPLEVDYTMFPTEEEEDARFERLGRKVSKDRSYVQLDYDLESKYGWAWIGEALRKTWNETVNGGLREFLVYNPYLLADFYNKRPVVVARRISSVVIPFSLWAAQYSFAKRFLGNDNGELSDEKTAELASGLRKALMQMGPTFVKIGQALSQRPDIAGPIFCDELKKLQDSVATFPTEKAFTIMEAEFDRQISEVFDFITPEPVAAASLGQVYKAHLIGAPENEFVAVKVQRPNTGIEASVDLYLTRKLASFLKKKYKLRTDLVGVNDEFGLRLFDETNYVQEARNCDRFRSLYNDIEGIFIPRTVPRWTTRYVLTMEWVEGTKAPWGEDALRLIDVGIQCTLRQLLDAGFFHADPHPGNLLRTVDGRLAYLDFGMMSQVEPQKRYDLIGSVVHLINKDYVNLTEDLVKLDFLPEDCNRAAISPLLENAFTKASNGGENMSNLSFNKVATNMASVAFKSPIRLPPYYSLIIRSLTILEGIALTENPDFKIVDESFPYVSKRILIDTDPELRARLREVLVDKDTGRLRWNRLQNIVREGESRSDEHHGTSDYGRKQNQDEVSIMEKMVEFLLSDEGEFLRDAIVEDVVDTVDSVQLDALERISKLTLGIIPPPIDKPNKELLSNVGVVLKLISEEGQRTRRRERSSRLQGTTNANLLSPSNALGNASIVRAEMRKASRAVVGGLLERNSSRLFRSLLSVAENAIGSQVTRAKKERKSRRQM